MDSAKLREKESVSSEIGIGIGIGFGIKVEICPGWTDICGQCIPRAMGCGCRGPSRRRGSCAASSWLFMLGALAVGCTAPVGVHRISVRAEHEELTRNALTTQEP